MEINNTVKKRRRNARFEIRILDGHDPRGGLRWEFVCTKQTKIQALDAAKKLEEKGEKVSIVRVSRWPVYRTDEDTSGGNSDVPEEASQ